MSLRVVNDLKGKDLSSDEIKMISNLMKWFGKDADYIITKFVIYGWPRDYSEAKKCIIYDDFCYNYAIGVKCNDKCNRKHDNDFCIKSLYKNNGKGISITQKRRAFYLSNYLFKYCGFKNSKLCKPILKDFNRIIGKDIDYKSLSVKYNKNWFPSNTVGNKEYRRYTRRGFEFDENGEPVNQDFKYSCFNDNNNNNSDGEGEGDSKGSEWSDNETVQTNGSCDTMNTTTTNVSIFSDDFYREWEYVMKISMGCDYSNDTEFYFSV